MTEINHIAEELPELTGSELKAIIAIYSEGRYINSTEMMSITGMSRKTCLRVMDSKHVQAAIEKAKHPNTENVKEVINRFRSELTKIQNHAK